MQKIIVHAGMFHSDDAFAAAAAVRLWRDARVVRVFKVEESEFADPQSLILDVGGRADGVRWFDHHQKDAPVRADGHKWAAFGQLWESYGAVLAGSGEIAARVREVLVDPIDRADNGVETVTPVREDWRNVSLSQAISWLNVDTAGLSAPAAAERAAAAFERALGVAGYILDAAVYAAALWVAARRTVDEAAAALRPGSRVLELSKGGAWQEHLFARPDLEDILYVVYPSERGGFCVQCVPDKPGSFGTRKALPREWAGLRGKDLASQAGLSSLGDGPEVFCHPGRFIGGASTREDALRMAGLAACSP